MRNPVRSKINRQTQRKRPLGLLVLLVLWSTLIGSGLSLLAQLPGQTQPNAFTSAVSTVDVIPQRYQLGQELYLENCATCHVGLPPAVLPSETWRDLIQDSQHYGTQITPIGDPQRLIVWDYIRTFSRTQSPEEERTPYRLSQSRYFKALHPKVKLPQPVTMAGCVSCHPGAGKYDFRTLSSEWQNAP